MANHLAPDRHPQATHDVAAPRKDGLLGGIPPRPVHSAARARDGGWFIGDGERHAELAGSSEDMTMLAILEPEEPAHVNLDRWALGSNDDYRLMKTTYRAV